VQGGRRVTERLRGGGDEIAGLDNSGATTCFSCSDAETKKPMRLAVAVEQVGLPRLASLAILAPKSKRIVSARMVIGEVLLAE
jgi:hypothetical protein